MSGQGAPSEDLSEKLNNFLSSPDAMDKIRSAMAAMGMEPPTAEPVPAPEVPSAPSAGLPDLGMLAKVAPLIGNLGKDTDDTRLLQALRPYLHGPREQRLDEAVQLLRLLRLLPLLQEGGLGGLLGGNAHGK